MPFAEGYRASHWQRRDRDTEFLTWSLQSPTAPCYFLCLFCLGSIMNCRLSNMHSCCCVQKAPMAMERGNCISLLKARCHRCYYRQQDFSNNLHWLKPEQQITANESAHVHPLENIWQSDLPSPAAFISSDQSRWSWTQLQPGMLNQSPADDPIWQLVQPSALLWVCLQWSLFLEMISFG